jgi:hypothetical protein
MKISEAMEEGKRIQADVASGITLRIESGMVDGRLSVQICGKETSSVSNCAEAEAWFEKRGFGAANWRPHNWVAASWAARSARSAAENQERHSAVDERDRRESNPLGRLSDPDSLSYVGKPTPA